MALKGYDDIKGLFKSRYYAKKYAKGDEVVVKVEGGYTVMTADYYRIWKNQKQRTVLKMKKRTRKPRLNKKTIETLFHEGKAQSGKYEYEITRDWNDELNTFVVNLTRWDKANNYESFKEWEIPAEGIWAFEK